MGAPPSAIFSEIYLQEIEHTNIFAILVNNNIHNYFRYVDDILLLYDVTVTDITTALEQFNNITSNVEFTIEHETNKQINFLDIPISRQQHNFQFDIYCKPSITGHIISMDSCHPSTIHSVPYGF
jgi:hypothetical protein